MSADKQHACYAFVLCVFTADFERLLTWYSIITVLFRCPPTLRACDETSPPICKPYFQLRQAVGPYVEPYYRAHVAPYVELARPYYDNVDHKVVAPAKAYAMKLGGPQAERLRTMGKAEWEKNVQPQLAKYRSLAKVQYHRNVAPHVEKASTTLAPYYDVARTNALQTYHDVLLPSYEFVQPYVRRAYLATSGFARETAVPVIVSTWNKTYLFLDGTVWPKIRVFYVEKVEPQLVKIGQRLGRYQGKKATGQKSVLEPPSSAPGKPTSYFAKPTQSATSSSSLASSSQDATSPSTNSQTQSQTTGESGRSRTMMDPVPAPEIDETESGDDVRRIARETVTVDLKDWQERYARAAEEGAVEIEERIDEITQRMIERNARTTGQSLLGHLQSAVISGLDALRNDIKKIVEGVADGPDAAMEEAQEQVLVAVRMAGLAIKEKAQAVRDWREAYEEEMQHSITKAAENHFKILEGIRDLALQKIGMKWAWMDGVTYKDWAKYHLLKSRFDEWQDDLERLVVTHPGLEAAQLEGTHIEDEAMESAAAAAKELARLKQVAAWKLAARDASDEFDSDITQQAAEDAERARREAAAAALASEQAALESKESPDASTPSDESSPEAASVVSAGTAHEQSTTAPVSEVDTPDMPETNETEDVREMLTGSTSSPEEPASEHTKAHEKGEL